MQKTQNFQERQKTWPFPVQFNGISIIKKLIDCIFCFILFEKRTFIENQIFWLLEIFVTFKPAKFFSKYTYLHIGHAAFCYWNDVPMPDLCRFFCRAWTWSLKLCLDVFEFFFIKSKFSFSPNNVRNVLNDDWQVNDVSRISNS